MIFAISLNIHNTGAQIDAECQEDFRTLEILRIIAFGARNITRGNSFGVTKYQTCQEYIFNLLLKCYF